MTNDEIQTLIDLIMYLDVSLNWQKDIYLNDDIGNSMYLISTLSEKHREFSNVRKRQNLIKEIIVKLNELKKGGKYI